MLTATFAAASPERRRTVRLMATALMIAALPGSGILWVDATGTFALSAAALVGATCMSLVVILERWISLGEEELRTAVRKLAEATAEGADAGVLSEEKIRQQDRVIDVLSNQNLELRERLIMIYGKLNGAEPERTTALPQGEEVMRQTVVRSTQYLW